MFDDYLKDATILGGKYDYKEVCQKNGRMHARFTAAVEKFVNIVVQSEYSSDIFRNLTFVQASKLVSDLI
jgi:hypothetical protein